MKSVWKLLIIVMFSISSAWAAENINANMFICADPDQPAIFPGSIEEGIPKFFGYNMKYPKESWRAKRVQWVRVEMVIDTDGKVTNIRNIVDTKDSTLVDPALDSEIKRVLGKMTWYPAEKNGVAVNVDKTMLLRLCKYSDYSIPYGMEYVEHDADKCLKKLRDAKEKNEDIICAEPVLKDAAELFPFNTATTISYATLESSLGNGNRAINIMDRNLKHYQTKDPLFYSDTKANDGIEPFLYIGRRAIGLAMMRAIQHDFNSSPQKDNAYLYVTDLIDQRMLDGELYEPRSKNAQKAIDRMKRDMVNEFFRKDVVGINEPVWAKKSRAYSTDEISYSLSYWSDRGRIDNAQVAQLTALIDQTEWEISRGKKATRKDELNLFGAKAMAIWMQAGETECRNYINTILANEPSRQLKSYLNKLDKKLSANAALLADRKAVLQSLACMVPPEGTDAAGVQAFYDRRKAVEDVFPIKWLSK